MADQEQIRFEALLCRALAAEEGAAFAFAVLPMEASALLPRRGRMTVDVTLAAHAFRVTLEPDGRGSHWLRLPESVLEASGNQAGETASFRLQPVDPEPDPELPADFAAALVEVPEARATWAAATPIARVDWIHWITTAKLEKTRAKRIRDACGMLASGKKRVCCFDASGIYSKAFSAPVPGPLPPKKRA